MSLLFAKMRAGLSGLYAIPLIGAILLAMSISPVAQAGCGATPGTLYVGFLTGAVGASADLADATEGVLAYDSVEKQLVLCDGTEWQSVKVGNDPVVVQRAQIAYGTGNRAYATFSTSPAQGSLLVAISGHRKDTGDNSIEQYTSGSWTSSGWTQHVNFQAYNGNSNHRRGLAIWTKVAGANDGTQIRADFGDEGNRLIIQEFSITNGSFVAIDKSGSNVGNSSNATSVTTGTTATTSSATTLVVGAVVARYSIGTTPSSTSWSNGLGSPAGVDDGGSTYPTMVTAFSLDTTASAKQSTASWSNSVNASGGIIAYKITPN